MDRATVVPTDEDPCLTVPKGCGRPMTTREGTTEAGPRRLLTSRVPAPCAALLPAAFEHRLIA